MLNLIIDRHYMVLLCILLILISFFFKLGLVPFHQWLPDVYEGSANHVTSFLSTVTKLPIVIIFITLISGPFMLYSDKLKFPFLFIGCLSMLFGTSAALFQNNLKRILAYSSLNHFGLILCILPNSSSVNIQFIMLYLLIYIINMIGIFSIILTTIPLKEKNSNEYLEEKNKKDSMDLSELSNKFNKNPYLGSVLALFFLSSAGIPPLGGFFSKYFILQSFVNQGLYIPSACIILASLMGTFYYIRLVAFCFFYDTSIFKVFFTPFNTAYKNRTPTSISPKYESLLTYRLSRINTILAVFMSILNLIIPIYIIPYIFSISYL